MEKNRIVAIIIVIAIMAIVSFGTYQLGRAHSGNNTGDGGDRSRETELLERIGEYQRREEERARREGERIAAEAERIKRTEDAIGALRAADRRTSTLLQELAKEVDILADYLRGSRSVLDNDIDNYNQWKVEVE